jgi:APA family basic amino acid/polyamine antiporter
MARDGLFPAGLAKINLNTRTPIRIIVISWVIISFCSALIPIDDLISIVNIGTLTAFSIVCGGVLVLRYTQPDLPRPFKTPLSPWVPALGILSCLYLIFHLPEGTIFRFLIWSACGFVIYFSYSRGNLLKKR